MHHPALETIVERLSEQSRCEQEDLCRLILQQVTRGKPVAPATLRASLQVSQNELEQRDDQLNVQEETERAQAHQERSLLQMPSAPGNPPTFLSVAPRFVVQDLEQALTFYEQLGFQTTYHDEAFAIVERDGVDLHLNGSPDSPRRHGVCWIAVTNIDALYQQYLPTNAVQSAPKAQPWGLKEFFLRDPFGNLLLFAE